MAHRPHLDGTLALTAAIVAVLLFKIHGGDWFIVKTPSMGTTAPVGTLVLTMPTKAIDLHVGDVIAFHPPTTPNETYTHRIVKISPTGLISTKGDINGATDPWQLTQANLIGNATVIPPGAGWLIRGLPIILLGIITVWVATSRVKIAHAQSVLPDHRNFSRRVHRRILFETLHRGGHRADHRHPPLPHRDRRVHRPVPHPRHRPHGTHVDLATGQLGTVSVPPSVHHGFYAISTALHLSFWEWVALIVLCCLPLLWTLIVGLPPKDEVTA